MQGRTVRFVHLPKALDPAQAVEAQRQKLVDMRISEFKARQSLARLGKGDSADADADDVVEDGMWDEDGHWAHGSMGQNEWDWQPIAEEATTAEGQQEGSRDAAAGEAVTALQAQAGPRVIPHRNHSRHRKKPWPEPAAEAPSAVTDDQAHMQLRLATGQLQPPVQAPTQPQQQDGTDMATDNQAGSGQQDVADSLHMAASQGAREHEPGIKADVFDFEVE